MSTQINGKNEADLIDFEGVPSRLSPVSQSEQSCSDPSENLLDTELPVLEEKLQTASQLSTPIALSRRPSADPEDILIDIDGIYSEDEEFLEICDNNEAFAVLKNLDDVLDEAIETSSSTSQVQQELDDCLEDLDNYLENLDKNLDNSSSEEDDEQLRTRLRRIEENYRKYLASGYVNKGYVETEVNATPRRPQSACDSRRRRSTQKKRPSLPDAMACLSGTSHEGSGHHLVKHCLGSHLVQSCLTSQRGPGPQPVDPYLTGSYFQASEHLGESSEHPHQDLEYLVHPSMSEPATCSSSPPAADWEPGKTWLRSSMRRLRHLQLPSNEAGAPGRPVSAPSRLPVGVEERSSRPGSRASGASLEPEGRGRSSSASSASRRRRSLSSSGTSAASTMDSAANAAQATEQEPSAQTSPRRSCDRTARRTDMPEADSPLGQWPHGLSSMLACLGCTLGLFNISRFSVLTVRFGANFIFQFGLLTLLFGLPLFTLQLCLGQQLGAGAVDMWRISPLFQGVGVALLLAQAMIGMYSIIGVSWMFVYFRDSFVTKVDKYRWAEPFINYRKDMESENATSPLSKTLPEYFNGVVLQRHHHASPSPGYGTIKFQLAFNLAVVWMIVFVSLSKGLRSYGKVIFVFTLLPVFGTFILCAKILGLMPPEFVNVIFPETSWGEFFLNPKSWLAASQEVFLTWGLLGAAVMQIASHNRHKQLLQRDSSLVAVITLTILLLVAFLANTCVQILKASGYSYLPDSFETMSSYPFLRSFQDPLPPSLANTPVRSMTHNSFILGDKVVRPNIDLSKESGYMVLRLATELVPATFAAMGSDQVSPFWAVLFYFVLIMFGIAQQLAIWHCVITGIMAIKSDVLKCWETTITFFSCACGFILGLPMATEMGIYVVYFLDYVVGGTWWLVIVIIVQIMAVFMVRGRPYSGDTVVTALFYQSTHPCLLSWAPPLLSFTWNVILPVALMVLCIASFKNGSFRDMFVWHHAPLAEYWSLWARQIGSILQLTPIICIPVVAFIQSYRYLNNGPNDILDRIQLLYRPPIGEHMDELGVQEAVEAIRNETTAANAAAEDPPPKYTPPPSYTTATGARIAKFLRQSIRRSVRRIANVLGEGSSRQRTTIPTINTTTTSSSASGPLPPPDYSAVLVEMNQTPPPSSDVSVTVPDAPGTRLSTLERLRNLESAPNALTAAEVASILRSSFRRSTVKTRQTKGRFGGEMASLSAQNLIDSAAPIGEMSLVMEQLRRAETGGTSSVI